uniref:Uncharacterized protein n=1 Tax=Arundo donax TaxID=35708 RepID=A0A0A9C1Y6_ARUDO
MTQLASPSRMHISKGRSNVSIMSRSWTLASNVRRSALNHASTS